MFCPYRVLIYGSHAILINLCKDKNGKIPFSSASVVLLSEVIKVDNVAFKCNITNIDIYVWVGTRRSEPPISQPFTPGFHLFS